jgi:uncharacterized protein (TIGR03118 family)
LALTLLLTVAFLPPPPAARRAAGSVAAAQEALVPTISPGSAYRQTNLISDVPGLAPVLDLNLVNPWGISVRGASPFWVSNQGTDTTQLIRDPNGAGPVVLNPNPQTITVTGGDPTGTVGNSTTDFQITPPGGGTPAAASFIFASLSGHISAWNGASGAATQDVVSMPGHVWTGLAIGAATGGNRLYAADFAQNHIDVFNGSFAPTTVPGGFVDPTVPAGYAPYNIHNLGGSLYVTYAKVPAGPGPPERGPGLGYVRKFDTDGALVPGFAINQGVLNAPWGLAIAPAGFGAFGGKLLVGNFADEGYISAYDPSTGAAFVPTSSPDNRLRDESNNPIEIDELWALQFGNGGNGGNADTLYFTAGIGEEKHGLFGKLNPTTAQAASLIQFATDNFATDEAGGHVDFTVIRTGDTSGTATVNYNTFDEPSNGHASQKSDYEIALGTLTFAPGETSKTFRILIVNDNFVEGDEVIDLMLSNPTGAGVGLGSPNTAEVRILDNDNAPSASNPIDDPAFFVRQHYLDFLNREPDASGFAFWTDQMTNCGNPNLEVCRVNVSAAFFLSIEFQRTGVLAYATHRAAFGPKAAGADANVPVLYGNFMRDVQALQRGLVFGQPNFDAQLEANKVAYFNEFVTRPEFVAKYPASLSNADYVDALLKSANLSPDDFIVNMTNSQEPGSIILTTSGGAPRPASYGTARFVFNSGRTALTVSGTVNNIDFTGSQTPDTADNLTNAHIHASSADPPPPTRGVVWGFIGTPFNDNNPNDAVVTPFASGVGGTFSGKWDAPEGNNTTLAAQLDNLLAGRAYINFHTVQFGGGEIRGNFPALVGFRDSLVAGLNGGTLTRATVLRMVAESQELQTRERNATFVTMEYFGYLRRDPDASGFSFWLGKLNDFNGNFITAEMVKAFITSTEYRQRFGPS